MLGSNYPGEICQLSDKIASGGCCQEHKTRKKSNLGPTKERLFGVNRYKEATYHLPQVVFINSYLYPHLLSQLTLETGLDCGYTLWVRVSSCRSSSRSSTPSSSWIQPACCGNLCFWQSDRSPCSTLMVLLEGSELIIKGKT